MRGWVRDGLGSFTSDWSCIILLARSHLSGSALRSLLSASCQLPAATVCRLDRQVQYDLVSHICCT